MYQKGNKYSSKYKEEYADELIEFFESCVQNNRYPSFEKFQIAKYVDDETLKNWCDKHERFRKAYEYCKKLQRDVIIEKSMHKEYDGSFAKFILAVSHDMREKQQIEIEQPKPLQIEISVKK